MALIRALFMAKKWIISSTLGVTELTYTVQYEDGGLEWSRKTGNNSIKYNHDFWKEFYYSFRAE